MAESKLSFIEKANNIVSGGRACLCVALGAELGLFKALGECDDAITVQQLADITQCKERYLKEWLGSMVVFDIVEVDESGNNYTLPKDHWQALCDPRCAALQSSQVVPALAFAHDKIVHCFRSDGPPGVPFDDVSKPWDVINKGRAASLRQVANIITTDIEGLKESLDRGIKVMDVGCGSGYLTKCLALEFPNSTFIGIDISETMVEESKESSKEITNVEYFLMDAVKYPDEWCDSYDVVLSVVCLHDIALASKCIEEMFRVIKPNGKVLIVEVNCSSNIFEVSRDPRTKDLGKECFPLSLYHCLPSSLYTPDSDGLGLMVGRDRLTKMLENAGFKAEAITPPAGMLYLVGHKLS